MARLVADNYEWLKKAARRYCRRREDAEDLASETACRLLASADSYDPARAFRPWALAIMQNAYITAYNRRRQMMEADLEDAEEAEAAERANAKAEFAEILRAVRRCALRSVCIESVALYAMGYGYQEISDIAGISVGTVKSRIAAGRRLIAEELG